jgi:soluble lytic murein transglycosylase-like protein
MHARTFVCALAFALAPALLSHPGPARGEENLRAPAYADARAAAGTEDDRLASAYAGALHAFNGRLSPETSDRLARSVIREADAAGLDARLVVALVAVESSWRVAAVSPAGAAGLGQLMPATARGLGVDPFDPAANVHGTVTHLAMLVAGYAAYPAVARYELALAAYNAGSGAVAKYGGIPPYAETQAYVRTVMRLWRRLAGG